MAYSCNSRKYRTIINANDIDKSLQTLAVQNNPNVEFISLRSPSNLTGLVHYTQIAEQATNKTWNDQVEMFQDKEFTKAINNFLTKNTEFDSSSTISTLFQSIKDFVSQDEDAKQELLIPNSNKSIDLYHINFISNFRKAVDNNPELGKLDIFNYVPLKPAQWLALNPHTNEIVKAVSKDIEN
jgi:hypothetical protein